MRQVTSFQRASRGASSVAGEPVRVRGRGAWPEAVEWRGRSFVVVEVMAMWCIEGRWWLDGERCGVQRRYFRLELQTVNNQVLCVEVFRSGDGQWRLWRVAD
jgi:hypothetical protein